MIEDVDMAAVAGIRPTDWDEENTKDVKTGITS
jgi:hypothetical protein